MIADVVGGARELLPQRLIHPLFEVRATHLVATDPNILGEQIHQRVEVAHIQR